MEARAEHGIALGKAGDHASSLLRCEEEATNCLFATQTNADRLRGSIENIPDPFGEHCQTNTDVSELYRAVAGVRLVVMRYALKCAMTANEPANCFFQTVTERAKSVPSFTRHWAKTLMYRRDYL